MRSTLTAIHLSILCKAVDVKRFGYEAILEPLLKDLSVLEQERVFIPSAGKNIKGTVYCVVADNVAAHSLGGVLTVHIFAGSALDHSLNTVKSMDKNFNREQKKPMNCMSRL